jgi:hypothetical protein
MCSLSWVRRRGSMTVVMNRDERRDRAPARSPRRWPGADGGFTAPVDGEAGGTWIAVRDSGVVLALLNHTGARPEGGRISRGLLVSTLAAERRVPDAARLRSARLTSYAPFRLVVMGPRIAPRVFTWNGATLSTRPLNPRAGFVTSSSWKGGAVIPARHGRFRAFLRTHPTPTRDDLLAFHRQRDDPRGPPWAICMARDDACTVSRTLVEWRAGRVSMSYRALTPVGTRLR